MVVPNEKYASKHRQCFRLAVPVEDGIQRLEQLASFASAMKINAMVYVLRCIIE